MRFLEIPALITEDIETPDIVDITEPISTSISGTTLTIDGGNKVSGESTITLTSDVNVDTITKTNLRQPSIHKISVKTNGKGNFTYTPNTGVTASSVSSTIKTGSDFEILLITTSGGDTYLDLDLADYTSPAVNFSNALTGFDISDLTSTYGATAKLYKPDGTLLSTTSSATTGSGVGFGAGVETTPQEVNYKLEVTDDVGRKSTYNLPRKWINYAMETNSTPGFQKFKLGTNEYTSTTVVPNLSSTTKARVYKTTDHGYLGINFKIQGRNSTSGAWTDIDSTAENVESDESAEFLAFGDYLYQRVWVKPTAQATTTVSSSNVVTLTLSNVTEDVTKTISGKDPYSIDEASNTYVFDETSRVGTVPFTITLGSETYTDSVSATTLEMGGIVTKTFHTESPHTVDESNILYKHLNRPNNTWEVSGSNDGNWLTYADGSNNPQFYKGSPESGYTLTQTVSNGGQGRTGTLSYDGVYYMGNSDGNSNATLPILKRTGDTFAAHSSDLTKHASVQYGPIAWFPNSYNFAATDSANEKIYFYEFDSSNETWSTTWNSGTLTVAIDAYSARISKDGEYLVATNTNGYDAHIFKCDWTAQTVTLQHTQTGNCRAAAVDYNGEYVIAGDNSVNTKILKRSGTTWTDVTTSEGFTNLPYIRYGAQFLGVPSQYLLTGEYDTPGQTSSQAHTFLYKWRSKKETTLTYNGKDKLTIAHKGGITPSSVKLYKDGVLYHTFGAETMVFVDETGVYQAISDDTYYSNKVTVTAVTETEAQLYINNCTTFLLKKDGKVWYWGESANGSNGMGNNTEVALPTLNTNLNALPSGIKQIGNSANDLEPNTLITNDGKLYTWGKNTHGGLGRGNESDYTSQGPWLVDTQSSNTFTFCHSSGYENFALQDNGYLWSCGYGGYYTLGNGSNSNINRFGRIDLANVIDFRANHYVALALTNDGKVYIWGTESNSSMAGFSTTATPTHMTALDGKNIVKVRTGGYTGHAISSDGKLYSWGKGSNYGLPSGLNSDITAPTEMTWFSRKNIKVVDVQVPYDNAGACLALDDQDRMYVWGEDDNGAIGVGPGDSSPGWPFLLKENIASIVVGVKSCGCIDKFGQVYTWGDGGKGVQNWIHGAASDTDINLPTSNNLSVGTSVVYDGFDRYVFGKGSTATSNVTYGSNTLALDTKSEVFVTDPHTYKFKITDTDSVTYTSNVVSTVSRPTGRVYPPRSGTHKNLTTTVTPSANDTWTIDGALYGNGDYKSSMDKARNGTTQFAWNVFNGIIHYDYLRTDSGITSAAIQLHMPQKIKLTKYVLYSRYFTGNYTNAPKDWKVYGSNDETNWTELDSQTNQTVTAWGSETDHRDTKREYTVTGNTKYFSSYKLDVTATGGGQVDLNQIEYYGDEEGFLSDDGFGKLTLDVKGDTSATSNITFHSNTFVMGAARDLYIKDTGEYSANIYGSSKAFLGEKTHTAGTQDLAPGFTAVFHHGAFSSSDYSSAYSTVAAAATAGHVYSDTPAGTYTWGTLAHVKERENPDFTANSTLHTDYSSTYGWSSNSGWAASADSQHDNSEANYGAWKAFDKLDSTFWHSNHSSGVTSSTPATLTIQYPSSQVIKSYTITSRSDATNTRFPSVWKLQGYDGSSWVDVGSEQTATTWPPGTMKRFDVSTNTTAYTKYQLRITTTIRGASTPSTSDYAAIAGWKLYTLNSENDTVHNDYTKYTWTPSAALTGADILTVAGGGGGGSWYAGGGGGAGGLILNENVSLSSGQKTIQVGNGGDGAINNALVTPTEDNVPGRDGYDTYVTGLTVAIGGGGGASYNVNGNPGGSGGGGGYNTTGGSGTTNQGYKGGDSSTDNWGGGGGGGSGGAGADESSSGGNANGGIGTNLSSKFGTIYGDSGWFASGGGGSGRTNSPTYNGGSASQGGGTSGVQSGTASDAQKYTGGGGGGAGWNNSSSFGGDGGSGIVIIKKDGATNPPALNFDGYNKLSIDNTHDKSRLTVPVVQAESGFNFSSVHADHVDKLGYPFPSSGEWASHHFVKVGTDGDKVLFDLLYVGTAGNPNSTTTVAFDTKTGTWSTPHPTNDPGSFSSTESGTYTSTLTVTDNNSEVHFKRVNGTYLGFITLTGWDKTVPDNVYTIKKDNAVFATTTSNTVYIREAGTYTAEVKGSGAYTAEVSKVVSGTPTHKQVWNVNESQILYASDAAADDTLGISINISGDYMVVGAQGDDSSKGAAYIYTRNGTTWSEQQKITASDGSAGGGGYVGDRLGASVGISGDYVIAGAPLDDQYKGAAYIYVRSGTSWSQQQKITASNRTDNDRFGSSVSISGDYAIVGSHNEDTGVTDAGSAYIYVRSGTSWSQQQRIQSSDVESYDSFGWSVSIDGDYAIVGASTEDPGGTSNAGSAYIFKRSGTTWSQQAKIQASDKEADNQFGQFVSIDGDYVIVGSHNEDTGGADAGAAYIFKRDTGSETWSEQQKIQASDKEAGDRFGNCVDIKGEFVIVGGYQEDTGGSNSGAVYIFERSGTTWTEVKKITASDAAASDEFGQSVAIDGTTAVVGSRNNDTKASNAGAAYVFDKSFVGPTLTYDGKNKLTIGGCDYADTSKVTKRGGTTYDIGTAKTMYVKETGDYDLEVSGSDKFAAVTVNVGSIDLAGATTKPIDFDGINKLTLIDAGSNAVSNVTISGTKHELGSATKYYIKDTGTYTLEMSGSNVFALSSNIVGSIISSPEPDDISGLTGWYKGSSYNTSTNQWEDVSGNNRHMTEKTGTLNVNSSGINGEAYVYADRYSGIKVPTTAHSVDNHTPNYTFFFVGKWTAGSSIRGRILEDVIAGYYSGWYGRQHSGHNRYTAPVNGADNKTTSNSNITGDDWALVTDFNYGFRINGTDRANASSPAKGGMTQLCINNGFYNAGSRIQDYEYSEGCSWAGAEMICYNRVLTADEISLIESYLQNKYSISNDIPGGVLPSLTFDGNNKLSVTNFTTTDHEWPPASFTSPAVSDGNPGSVNGITSTNSDKNAEWVISGADYGNGTYKASTNIAVHSSHPVHGPFQMFNKINGGLDTKTTTTHTSGEWTIELPISILLHKYNLHHGNSVSTSANYPKDWTIEGSNDGTTWVVLDTRSNETYASSVTGFDESKREYTVSNNTTKYKHYKLNVTAIGSGSYILIGAWRLFEKNTRTGTLTDPNGGVHTLGQTQDTFYISETGNYTLDVRNNDQKAIVTKTVSGTLSASPGTPSMTSFFIWRENGTDYTESSPSGGNVGWDNLFVNSSVTGVKYLDGHHGSGIGFAMDIHFDQTFTVNTVVFKFTSDYSTYKDISFRCGESDSSYITVDPGQLNYANKQTITFTFSSPITVNKLYFAVVQDGGSDLYNLLCANGDIIINDLAYPLAAGVAQSPSPALNFDGYNKLSFKNTDSDATSNIDFFSNTYEMGSRKELIISDYGTYYANIHSSNTLALTKTQITEIAYSSTIVGVFHYGTFSSSDYSSAYSTVSAAATAGHIYSDTPTNTTYSWGILNSVDTSTPRQTGYSWTPSSAITGNVLIVGGGGGGGPGASSQHWNSGGGGGKVENLTNQTISAGTHTIIVGDGNVQGSGGATSSAFGTSAAGGGAGSVGTSGTSGSGNGPGGNSGYNVGGGGGDAASGVSAGNMGGNGGDGSNVSWLDGSVYGEQVSGKAYFGGGGYGGDSNGSNTNGKGNGVPGTGGGGTNGGTGRSGIVVINSVTEAVSISDTPADSATFNLKYTVTGDSQSRMPELSIVNGLGTHTWSKTSSFTDKNGTEYDWMFIGEESHSSTTAATTVALPYTVSVEVVTGSPNSGFTDRIWNGRGSSTDNSEQKNCNTANGIIEIKGTYTSAIAPTYLLVSFTSGAKTDMNNGHLKTIDVIVSGKTYFSIDLGTTYGIAGDLMENYPSSSGNHSLFAIKLPNKIFGLPELKFDGYNKLTPPVIEPTFTSARISDWDNNNQSKSATAGSGDWPGTSFTGESDAHWWTLHNNDKCYTSSYNYGDSRDMAQLFTTVTSSDWGHGHHSQTGWTPTKIWKLGYKFSEGSKLLGSMKIWQAPASHPVGDVTIKYWDGTSLRTVGNQSPSGFPSSISYHTEQEFTFDSANAQYWLIECKTHASSSSTNYIGLAGWQLWSGRDPVSTVITKGSDSYDIGTANNVYINAAGTYDAQAKNSNTFVIKTSNTVSAPVTRKQVWNANESQILYASDAQAEDYFGNGVKISGNYAIIGAQYEDETASNSGSAYIFYKSGGTWTEQAKLKASDAGASDYFGHRVDIEGDYAIVGAYNENSNTGSAYIFKRTGTTWAQQAKLTASNAGSGDEFGRAVGISGDYAFVGARREDTGGTDRGSVYRYKRSEATWSQEAQMQASDAQDSDNFGWALSVDGDYVIIGSYLEHPGGTSDAGSAYIFKKETASLNQVGHKIPDEHTAYYAASDWICQSVSGTVGIYKHIYRTGTAVDSGTNTIQYDSSTSTWSDHGTGQPVKFTKNDTDWNNRSSTVTNVQAGDVIRGWKDPTETDQRGQFTHPSGSSTTDIWTQQAKIQASDKEADDRFGVSVDIKGEYAIVGAQNEDTGGSNAGAAYIFKKDTGAETWTQQAKLMASNAGADDMFGGYDQCVAITSDYAVVGANQEDTGGGNAGAAYLYERSGTNWTEIKKLVASDAATSDKFGMSTAIDGNNVIVGAYNEGTKGTNAGAVYVFEKSFVGPTLTYDGSKKFSLSGVTTPSTNLTLGTNTYDIGSAKDVYIRDAGTYSFHTNDGNQALLMSNVVSSTPSGTTYAYNTKTITNIGLNKEIDSASGHHGQYTHGAANNTDGINDLNFTKTILTNGYPMDFSVVGQNIARIGGDGPQTLENGQWHSCVASGTGGTANPYFRINLEKDYYVDNCVLHKTGTATDSARFYNVRFQLLDSSETQIKEVNVGNFGTNVSMTADCKVSGVRYVKVVTGSSSGYTHYDEIRINGYDPTLLDGSATIPSQVYDTSNTFTVSNIPSGTSTIGKIYKDATAYTIHATQPTSNVVIKNTGSYLSVFTTSSTAYLTNAITVSSTPDVGDNTIEDEVEDTSVEVSKTIAFHDGTFADSDDPHGDGSITAAATAGHIYSDTATGTYTWGTLTSCERTAMANNEHSTENWAYRNGTADPPTAGFTTYKWTPPGAITNGRTLLVAGGGGGGTDMGGGGGAGGMLASTTTNIAHAEQTIQVGGGGSRGYSNGSSNMLRGGNGADSSISGPGITAIGGGGGASKHNYNTRPAGNGGSGGGGSGGRNSNGSHGGERGTGTPGQGHDGARSGNHWYPGGGGGAGEKGYGRDGTNNSNTLRGDGGNGLEDDILGTTYWWAGGGGCNTYYYGYTQGNIAGKGGKGGGGGGAPPHSGHGPCGPGPGDTNGITNGQDGDAATANWHRHNGGSGGKHTGGGGGGGDHHDQSDPTLMRGGLGGSGIVAIKFTAMSGTKGIAGSTAIAPAVPVADAPSLTLDATTEVATPTMNLNFTTALTSFPKTIGRYNISTHDTLGVVFDRTATRKKRVTKTINTDKFSMELTANNIVSESSTALPVTVSGGKFSISGSETPTLTLVRGKTYVFDQSDSTNATHPLRLSTTSNGTHGGGSQYTSGWSISGTPGSSNATRTLAVASDAPDMLYYYCQNHSGMGGTINVITHNLVTFGDFTFYANAAVSGEHTIATNFDGTTSNVYVDGALITSTSTSVTSGAKLLTLGQNYAGRIKDFKFWNLAKRFFRKGILESYSSFYTNLTGAYSVRLLFSNYTGAHVSIKRSSDNAEVDVTFDKNGVVVTPTDWTSWSGSDTLYVMKWYDQSGNNKFGTASGNPTYDKTNKRVVFDSNDYFTLPNGVAPTGDSAYSIIAYHNTIATTDGGIFGSGNYSTNDQVLALRRNTSNYTNYWWGDDLEGGTYAANTVVSATYRASGTTRSFYTNGVASSTTTTTTRNGVAGNETIGVTNNNGGTFQEYLDGELYELLVFDTGLSASTISGISTTLKTY